MNQPVRRYYPIENNVSHNLFCGNHQDTAFRRGWHDKTLASMEEIDYIEAADNRNILMAVFTDPTCLDFRFKEEKRPAGFPEISFDEIGLCVDRYRTHVPDKAAYRRQLAEKWDDRKSYDEAARYDPATVTELIYFNTGRLVFSCSRKP